MVWLGWLQLLLVIRRSLELVIGSAQFKGLDKSSSFFNGCPVSRALCAYRPRGGIQGEETREKKPGEDVVRTWRSKGTNCSFGCRRPCDLPAYCSVTLHNGHLVTEFELRLNLILHKGIIISQAEKKGFGAN